MREKLMHDLWSQGETLVLSQLGELVTRGLLVIEKTQPVLTQEPGPGCNLKVSQAVRLVLKDREYIEKLEGENADLKYRLLGMKQAVAGL